MAGVHGWTSRAGGPPGEAALQGPPPRAGQGAQARPTMPGMQNAHLQILFPKVSMLALALSLVACGSLGEPRHRLPEGASGPYSSTVSVGDLHFLSGKIGAREGSFEDEAESAISRVQAELAASDLTLGDVVSVTVYLTDMDRYDEFNRIYSRRFPPPYPARTCVAVAALPRGARVEIAVTAVSR